MMHGNFVCVSLPPRAGLSAFRPLSGKLKKLNLSGLCVSAVNRNKK
jgi:hypothetical protein